MEEDRRASDSRIENIERMCSEMRDSQIRDSQKVNEIHQRQIELTIPAINEVKNTLYSKGGICEVVHKNTADLESLDKRVSRLIPIASLVFTGFAAGAGAILWIVEHGRSLLSDGAK